MRGGDRGRGRPRDHDLRHPLGLRRAAARPLTRPAAWTAGCPSRSTRGWPRTPRRPIAEARALWWQVGRPNLFIKIPATVEGLPAITAVPARRDQRERDADLLAGALRAGHRRLHGGPGGGRTDGTCPRSARWPRSSSAGWTPRWTAGWPRSAPRPPTRCAARPRSPTRGWLTSCTSRSSRLPGGRRCRPRGPAAAAAVGVHQHQGSRLPGHHVRRGTGRAGTVNTMPEATLHATAAHGELRGDTIHGTL